MGGASPQVEGVTGRGSGPGRERGPYGARQRAERRAARSAPAKVAKEEKGTVSEESGSRCGRVGPAPFRARKRVTRDALPSGVKWGKGREEGKPSDAEGHRRRAAAATPATGPGRGSETGRGRASADARLRHRA